jgi:hypothetical protein
LREVPVAALIEKHRDPIQWGVAGSRELRLLSDVMALPLSLDTS